MTGVWRLNTLQQAMLDSLSGQGSTGSLGLYFLTSIVAPSKSKLDDQMSRSPYVVEAQPKDIKLPIKHSGLRKEG